MRWFPQTFRGALMAGMLAARLASAEGLPSEYQGKAAYLLNFMRFVEWPPCAGDDCDSMRLCVFGWNPFGTALDDLAAANTVSGRKLVVKYILDWKQLRDCHLAFVPRSETSQVDQLFEMAQQFQVLLVGERKGFAEQGGSINFFLENDRLRFEINPAAAARAHLKISSKLLKLARICSFLESKRE